MPVTRGIVPLVALATTNFLIFAPLEWKHSMCWNVIIREMGVGCHTIAQAGRFIAPATVMRPGEARVHPCALIPLQPHPLKHG